MIIGRYFRSGMLLSRASPRRANRANRSRGRSVARNKPRNFVQNRAHNLSHTRIEIARVRQPVGEREFGLDESGARKRGGGGPSPVRPVPGGTSLPYPGPFRPFVRPSDALIYVLVSDVTRARVRFGVRPIRYPPFPSPPPPSCVCTKDPPSYYPGRSVYK